MCEWTVEIIVAPLSALHAEFVNGKVTLRLLIELSGVKDTFALIDNLNIEIAMQSRISSGRCVFPVSN